ncbi:MAG: hypothetical protein U0547_07865 [Dehalococcoidia bacterium]
MNAPRLAMLLAGLAATAALAASSAAANLTGSSSALGVGAASVEQINLALIGGQFVNHDQFVPANGTPQRTDDIRAFEGDPNYALRVINVQVTNQGLPFGAQTNPLSACYGLAASRYSIQNLLYPTGDLVDGPVGQKVAELHVTIPPSVTAACAVGGAAVTITFEAVAGPDL